MSKFSGFGGGNTNNMFKQVQKMQKDMEDLQAQLDEEEITATAGGGIVTVTANGKKRISKISIDKSAVDPDDLEMLEDLIVVATNEALKKVDELVEGRMKKITGGIGGIPGLF